MHKLNAEHIKRYRRLVAAAMGTVFPFVCEAESETAVQIERGMAFPMSLCNAPPSEVLEQMTPAVKFPAARGIAPLAVIDRAGHARPLYGGMLAYCWIQALTLVRPKLPPLTAAPLESALGAWCNRLEAELHTIYLPTGSIAASSGSDATHAAWTALALHVAGQFFEKAAWREVSANTFDRLTCGQQSSGALLNAGPADNPETHWYHELVILHAVASFAVQARQPALRDVGTAAAEYHLQNTQPDHASNQPWGLLAFICHPPAWPVADGMLHAAEVQNFARPGGVASLLLADTLYCLRLLESEADAWALKHPNT